MFIKRTNDRCEVEFKAVVGRVLADSEKYEQNMLNNYDIKYVYDMCNEISIAKEFHYIFVNFQIFGNESYSTSLPIETLFVLANVDNPFCFLIEELQHCMGMDYGLNTDDFMYFLQTMVADYVDDVEDFVNGFIESGETLDRSVLEGDKNG